MKAEDMTNDDEDRIIDWVSRKGDVNLMKAADSLGLDWAEVSKRIQMKGRLYNGLELAFQELKYKLMAKITKAVMNNERTTLPSITHIRFVIQMIDSGVLLGSPMPDNIDSETSYNSKAAEEDSEFLVD